MPEGLVIPIIDYGVESVRLEGQSISGDMYIIKKTDIGVLIGVVDGVGHGTEAAAAADLAVSTLSEHADESLITLAKLCHERLKGTRGAVMALAAINQSEGTLTWLSIGNVEGVLIRSDPQSSPVCENIVKRSGVVGYRLPPIYASVFSISNGDIIILSTDGVREDYAPKIVSAIYHANDRQAISVETVQGKPTTDTPWTEYSAREINLSSSLSPEWNRILSSPKKLAEYICRNFSKGSDDALVVAAKYIVKT